MAHVTITLKSFTAYKLDVHRKICTTHGQLVGVTLTTINSLTVLLYFYYL